MTDLRKIEIIAIHCPIIGEETDWSQIMKLSNCKTNIFLKVSKKIIRLIRAGESWLTNTQKRMGKTVKTRAPILGPWTTLLISDPGPDSYPTEVRAILPDQSNWQLVVGLNHWDLL